LSQLDVAALYQSKSRLAYEEVKAIILTDALLREDYYNGNTSPIKYKICPETEMEKEYNI